jgi:hypothetical protein
MIGALALAAALGASAVGAVSLAVPAFRQAPERCGPAALAAVMAYFGADARALAEAETAYSPALRGTLVTDLAGAARRAGFEAAVETGDETRLRALLGEGVPPIVLYARGTGPVRVPHYGVVTGWDPGRGRYEIADGTGARRTMRRDELVGRWRRAGSLLVVVHRP